MGTWDLFRDAEGKAACIRDECAHRACPLSLGTINDGRVTCAYHGWEFNGQGACEKMPSTPMCKGVGVRALQVVEQDGLVFVWTGEGTEPDIEVPDLNPPEGYTTHRSCWMCQWNTACSSKICWTLRTLPSHTQTPSHVVGPSQMLLSST